jgi:quercetin dioxygenase-like cupin family protein
VSLARFATTPTPTPADIQAKVRPAHPSADGTPARIRPVGSLSFRALRAIAAGLARVEQPLPLDGTGDGTRSSRLIATAFYDVWLITWPDGSGLEPHGHGDVRSVLQVVDGKLVETYSDRAASVESAVRTLERGSVTIAEPTVVHGLSNRSGADATTLHVYSPPLVDVTFFDLHPAGSYEAVRSTPVVGRPAQATSEGLASAVPTPLTLLRP